MVSVSVLVRFLCAFLHHPPVLSPILPLFTCVGLDALDEEAVAAGDAVAGHVGVAGEISRVVEVGRPEVELGAAAALRGAAGGQGGRACRLALLAQLGVARQTVVGVGRVRRCRRAGESESVDLAIRKMLVNDSVRFTT